MGADGISNTVWGKVFLLFYKKKPYYSSCIEVFRPCGAPKEVEKLSAKKVSTAETSPYLYFLQPLGAGWQARLQRGGRAI